MVGPQETRLKNTLNFRRLIWRGRERSQTVASGRSAEKGDGCRH